MGDYLAINKNINVLKQSSSGGVFYALAKYILDRNGIVFGAAWNKDWLIDMCYVTKSEDLPKLMGSKYIQADIKNTFRECKEFLDTGKLVLYTGLPCQLSALKAFLKKDYPNLYLVDIACHGLMPLQIWKDYLETITRLDAKIVSITFRAKDPNWSNYSFIVKYSDGKVIKEHHRKNKYMQAFLCDKYLKPSCYNCKFKNKFSKSDLCIGDAWGVQDKFETKDGISFIKVYTTKGQKLLEKISTLKLTPYNYIDKPNGCLRNINNTKPCQYNKNIFNKKVAIITLPLHSNIGGILQAFALSKKINELGYSSEVITCENQKLLPFAKDNIKLRVLKCPADFWKIKETDYNIYVVGSDQIWRRKYTTLMLKNNYVAVPFLIFTRNWIKTRLSYAASFGVSGDEWEYTSDENTRLNGLLKNFNAISVREDNSIEDCKNKLNTNVVQCVDPTLLLTKDNYIDLCSSIPENKADVGIYLLDETPETLTEIGNYCTKNNYKYTKISNNSVEAWLSLFRDAKYIITDSFHGCLFAAIFEKPFICIYNKKRGGARFDSLAKMLKINNIVYNINELADAKFNVTNKDTIGTEIDRSVTFLKIVLKIPGNGFINPAWPPVKKK